VEFAAIGFGLKIKTHFEPSQGLQLIVRDDGTIESHFF